ncbi:hypothetical protein [Motilimonas eburnea]|uniref:hypothetical protein n=1 Tax=Motilimonas eburnea TaxID=1737488 RepID=UPI001E43E1BC|nr:hypothetical protein [Motilimonas eburnea]MCE2572901.1 hypothetical protein [Motilimonas eburnea]
MFKLIVGLLLSVNLCAPVHSAIYSKDQVYLKKTREEQGLVVSVQSRVDGFLICQLRFRQDVVWMVLAAKEQGRPFLIADANFHEPSLQCSDYQGNKPHGAIWRVQPYKQGTPAKDKLITLY